MKTLIIHHLETIWESGLLNCGTNLEKELQKLVNHLKDNQYDKVVFCRFEEPKLEDIHYHYHLDRYISFVVDYAYGWTVEDMQEWYPDEKGTTWDSTEIEHSKAVFLCDWMKQLKGDDVYVCGAFKNECIATLREALRLCEFNRQSLTT